MLEPTTRFREDLGAVSLDLLELIYAFEQEFGVQIPEAEAIAFQTLGHTVRWVEQAHP